MKLFAIYHRPTDSFSLSGSSLGRSDFSKLCARTHLFNNISTAKACLTNSLKGIKQFKNDNLLDFILALEIIEVEVLPKLETSLYSAVFSANKI